MEEENEKERKSSRKKLEKNNGDSLEDTEKNTTIGYSLAQLGESNILLFSDIAKSYKSPFAEIGKSYRSPFLDLQELMANRTNFMESLYKMPELPKLPDYPKLPQIQPDTSRTKILEYLHQKEQVNGEYLKSLSEYNNKILENNQKMQESFDKMVVVTYESVKSQKHMLILTIIMVIIAFASLIGSILFSH